MNEPAPMWRPPLWRRAAARLLDTVAMAVIEAVMVFVTFMIAGFLVWQDMSDERLEAFYMLWLLLLVPASIPVYRFEVVSTARSGQTWGKGLAEIRVVRWDGEAAAVGDQDPLERWRFGARWAIPHGAGLSVAVVAGAVSFSTIGEVGVAVPAAGLAAWLLVYSSALFDKNRRGWHDKAAGTVVVSATDDVIERLQEGAARGGGPYPQAPPDQSKHAKP